ncbi:hypothetical protein LUZ63_014414 [Rhynchospora breviuscula]|uniref:Acyl carrier protein n=1 Tax=Rhynchospora breviuscula TaxID=2022672 RepID=A0A9Q0CAX7_9POAL|nr:hypothetical protein LUZ63_014414 [Rhynchospora breviuscula]
MQHIIRATVLRHVRFSCYAQSGALPASGSEASIYRIPQIMHMSTQSASSEQLTTRVIELVKKYDKIDADKVTENADFAKDLSLDSLDRVELVMAIEQEFSIEIPDNEADKLSCCADIVSYIRSQSQSNTSSAS